MIDLTNQTALVTGGSRGIGRAIAFRLAGAGARVIIGDRTDHAAPPETATWRSIVERGGHAESWNLDINDSRQVADVVDRVESTYGLDILVNNAGSLLAGSITETTDEMWRQQFRTNVDGTFYCMRAAVRAMLAAGRKGKVVNITSISGLRANPGFAAYCSAKAAVVNLTRQAGIDYAPMGININSVAPGFVETDMTSIYDSSVRMALESQTPNGRWASPEQVADSVAFLCSPLSDHIVGEVIAVDGGWLVGTPVVTR